MLSESRMVRHRLDDAIWEKIYTYLKARPKIHTGNEEKCRKFVDAVHWIMRTGAQWRDLPEELGNWNAVFKRFGRWSDKGIWDELHEHFIDEPDMEWLLLDSTVVRAHPCAAGAPKVRRNRHWVRVLANLAQKSMSPLMRWTTPCACC